MPTMLDRDMAILRAKAFGAVFQLTDGLEHPLPCGITDAGGLVVDNAGHGGLGNIADLRNLGNAVNLFLWFLWQIVISFIKNP